MSEKRANNIPTIISPDLKIIGNLFSEGDIQMDGQLQGNIRSYAITVGQAARIEGEISGEIITICGHIKGTVRGVQVHLTAGSQIEGDIYHKTLAIESGAVFNGTAQREKDPLQKVTMPDLNVFDTLPLPVESSE